MNTPKNWFSAKTKKRINLQEIERKELINELVYLQKEYDRLLGEWEKQHEQKREIIKNTIKTFSTFGIGIFDQQIEREELEVFFDAFFCKIEG